MSSPASSVPCRQARLDKVQRIELRHKVEIHQMTGRMQYLIGSAAKLGQTWSAWGVGATREADQPQLVAHSALVYGITASGRVRTIYPDSFEPAQIAHDVPKLAAE